MDAVFRAELEHGDALICPTCEQHAKIYWRKLGSPIALAAVLIARNSKPGEWVHVQDLLYRQCRFINGDYTKLRYWRLLESLHAHRDDGSRRNGFHRLTPDGLAFVRNKLAVQRTAKIYNDECIGLEGPRVTIRECLNEEHGFRYDELMANWPDGPPSLS